MATDERSEAELRERVAELEQRLDNLTTGGEVAVDAEGREWSTADIMNLGLTRRQALGVLAVLAGSSVTIWAAIQEATGTASATGTAEVGQFGEPGRPLDGYVEDLYDTNDNPVLEFQGDGSIKSVSTNDVDTERIGVGDYHFAGSYDGADPDARLDNAISASSPGDRIFLERGTYSADRTITTRGTTFTGVDSSDNGTLGSGTWTLDGGEITIEDMRDITVVVNGVALSHIRGIQAGNITVNNNGNMRCLLTGLKGCSVTFASGTDTNVVDSSVATTVTDNGNNTVGEIA